MSRRGGPYVVIGHSLGGLALRAALSGLDPPPVHLVMLATPNRTPRLARRLHRLLPYRAVCGDSGQRSPFGGEANDWVVAVEETKVTPEDRPTLVPVGAASPRLDCQTPDRTA